VAIQVDLAEPQTAAETIHQHVITAFGRLDVLVNSAALYLPSSVRDVTMEQMRRLWAINFESPLLLCRAFESQLRAAGGHIINMLDLLAEKPWPAFAAYCASKAALSNLTLSLAREFAPEVTVNGIAPGVVDWPPDYPESEREKYLKRVPLGRAGTPDDVADAVVFFATKARYVTGQILCLDGGRSIT
jgi:pteridine reductase